MKAFLSGCALCALITVSAWFVLGYALDFSSATVYRYNQDNAVRLDPGMGMRPGES